MKSQKEGRMVPESNESLEKLVLLIPKSRRITVTDIRAITGSITGPLIWRSLELGRGEGFITGWGGGWLRGGIEHPPRLWNPEDRPLILCAHENLRELWQAAVLVFENAFPPKPSPPLPPLPRRITGIHASENTHDNPVHIRPEKREREWSNGRRLSRVQLGGVVGRGEGRERFGCKSAYGKRYASGRPQRSAAEAACALECNRLVAMAKVIIDI